MFAPGFSQAQQDAAAVIQNLSEQILLGTRVTVAGVGVASGDIIPEFYVRREFMPAWDGEEQIREFIELVGRAGEEGLNPSDYLFEELGTLHERFRQNPEDQDLRARLDVLLTESLIRYGNHLLRGKVDPVELDENWNWARVPGDSDPAAVIQKAIDSDSIQAFMADFLDRGVVYKRVRNMLADYRRLAANGGWQRIDPGPTLKPGMEDERIAAIRRRLAITGDLDANDDSGSLMFDERLASAVERFQRRHNLDRDGAIGKQTLAAMNVSAEDRVDQIRVNLERLRWVVRDLDDEYIVTNIAAFRSVLVRNRSIVWEARSQVGRFYRQTPVFRAKLEYLQFNPTWTVPPGILTNDVLPAVKADVGYLAAKNMDLINNSGSKVDPATVDWSRYGPGRLPPFQFVQRPGPTNALGRVKFIFPNRHFVFLHDTPSKSLFASTERAFSSGCIRVEHPFELAELLLDDAAKWNADSIQALLDSERPRTIHLKEPLTVMLLYATVGVTDFDVARFYKDIYERDLKVLRALDSTFELDQAGG
jgi:murein L,D-transpeptidase YcbB/YkuD